MELSGTTGVERLPAVRTKAAPQPSIPVAREQRAGERATTLRPAPRPARNSWPLGRPLSMLRSHR